MLRIAHIAMLTLWPSFLVAIVAEGLFFSVVDPHDLNLWGARVELSALAAYSIGFFFFWAFCALASMLTCYLMRAPDEKTSVRL